MKWPWPWRAPGAYGGAGGVPEQARAAFRAGLADGLVDLTGMTDAYVGWAQDHGTQADLAEAYWMRSAVTAREAMRRELPASRLRVLADSQHVAAAAGYHLAVAGRPRDAVIAVEHSRAILLTRLAGGLEPQLRARLLAAGRDDVLSSYLEALRRRADAYRRQYAGDAGEMARIIRGGQFYRAGVPSALEAAQADVARLARDVGTVAGGMDPLDLPRYEVIQQTARHAPVVYLGVAENAGYALVVRVEGEPAFVALPGLGGSALARHLKSFTELRPLPGAVHSCVDWLATSALTNVLPEISSEPEIALVPLGALNLLPLNAALLQATAHRPAGPLSVRYVPSARMAADMPRWPDAALPREVLVVDVAAAPGAPQLLLARAEAEALARRYAARRLSDATSQAVLQALSTADMVEFLCHGRADLADPLSSGLLLMDGWLTVRTLFSRPPLRRQLVILAACEGQVGGVAAPDEMVGLPAALYQAGAAGVVAAQWRVEERAALVLLRKFHDQLASGNLPALALSAAQYWLRTATWGEMSSHYPELFAATPRPRDPDMAAQRDASVPYEDPVHWSAFGYTGM